MLNVQRSTKEDSRRLESKSISLLTRSKISESLKGRKDSDITRVKKSESHKGVLNPFYGKGPGIKALDLAAEKAGTKIYAYDSTSLNLVNNVPFRSIRKASKELPISPSTLAKLLNSGKPFKGFFITANL